MVTHFSTYMLVNSQAWYNAWRENIDYRNSSEEKETAHYFDIAFDPNGYGFMDAFCSALQKQCPPDVEPIEDGREVNE